MVISFVINGFVVYNVLVDTSSIVDIIFIEAFRQMQEPEGKLQDLAFPLYGFRGQQVMALGKLVMPFTFGYLNNTITEDVMFDVVDKKLLYKSSSEGNSQCLRNSFTSSLSLHEDTQQ
jgi:hypothetical protein